MHQLLSSVRDVGTVLTQPPPLASLRSSTKYTCGWSRDASSCHKPAFPVSTLQAMPLAMLFASSSKASLPMVRHHGIFILPGMPLGPASPLSQGRASEQLPEPHSKPASGLLLAAPRLPSLEANTRENGGLEGQMTLSVSLSLPPSLGLAHCLTFFPALFLS